MGTENIARYLRALWGEPCSSVDEVVVHAFNGMSELSDVDDSLVVDALTRATLTYCERAERKDLASSAFVRIALASTSTALGRADIAKAVLGAALQEQEAEHTVEPFVLATIHGRKGSAHTSVGEYSAGEFHQRAALAILEHEDQPLLTGLAANNLGLNLLNLGRLEEAELYLRRALAIRLSELGDGHLDTIATRINIASILATRGAFAGAHQEVLGCIRDLRRSRQTLSTEYANCWGNMIAWSVQQRNYRKALLYARKTLAALESVGAGTALRATHLRSASTALAIVANGPDHSPSEVTEAHTFLRKMWKIDGEGS